MTQQPSRIVQENVDALIERERAGRIEHGDDMDRTDFPVEAWLAELISESLDSANYGRKLQHMLPKLVAAAKRLEGMGFAWADGSWQATCTCPSGDGSLRWPCPVHTAGVHGAVAKVGSDHFRSIVDWLGPIPPPNTLLYAAPVTAAPADDEFQAFLRDVSTAAELVRTGGQSKKLANRLREEVGKRQVPARRKTASTPAAPGIDLAAEIESLKWQLDRANNAIEVLTRTQNVREKAAEVIDASPKGDPERGHIDPSWSLHDRVEFALRDAGFDLDEAAFVAEAASVANGDLDSPKGGSEAWREGWALAYSGPSRLYGDDGELQDNSEYPYIDWRRDSAEVIRDKITERANRKLAKTQAGDAEVQP